MAILKEQYKEKIVPRLTEKFGYTNRMQVPGIEKIVVNVGLGEMAHQKELIESVRDELAQITAQRPVLTRARKSISNFKIRDGAPVGYKVTLRGERMYEFLERLINFVMPRIRDFRGVSRTAFDQNGNYTLGLKEQTIFPELELDKLPITHGMDISFVTTAGNREEAMSLLEGFGMPFAKK
jgi:large subunit ribosomal protein L5